MHNRLVWLWAADCMPGMICVQPLGETTRCQALAFTPNICMISGICPSKAVKGEDGAAEGDKEAVEGEDSAQDAKENTSA